MDISKHHQATISRFLRRAAAFGAVTALVSLWSSAAFAEQFVVLDSTWEHTPDLPDSHYRVAPLPGTPSDWRSPIDYASGTAYIHLEVYTKPTDTPTKFQVCFEAQPTYACTYQSPAYTAAGVLDWATPFSDFWSPPNTMVDWTKGTQKIAVILKDTQNGKPSEDNVGAEVAKLYMPTKVRMVVTIVAPGSEYVPPADPDAGAPDGGDADAGPVDPGPDASTGAGGSGQDAGSTDAPVDPGPGSAESDTGCSTAPAVEDALGSVVPAAWLLVAAVAALLVRARRK
jgi:MYXO-CTERM domain-containing protein